MQSKMNRKGLWLLLTLAVLIVAVAVIVTVAISADGTPAESGEIADFSYQVVRDADVLDSDTDLRFLFSIRADKLGDYGAVGFVFSKNNSNPVKESRIVDAVEKLNYFSTDKVYSSVNANGSPIAAPDGRYWVAVSLSEIEHIYFDANIYVRPFVEDTDGTTRYGETKYITVCSALGHTHTVSGSASEGKLFVSGHCDGCNLDDVCEYGITNPEYKRWVGADSNDSWADRRQMSDIKADKHFYPHASNNMQGNDLYVEYSVLWNETLFNFSSTQGDGARFEAKFASDNQGKNNSRAITYTGLTDDVINSGAKIAGAFEFPCEMIATSEPGNPYSDMVKNEQGYSAYPNIAGTDPDHPEWGWHRIGIVYHEDVTNLAAVRDNGATAQYKLTVTVYIDGQVVSILSGTNLTKGAYDYKLYTVEKVDENLVYTDINDGIWFFAFRIWDFCAPTHDAYFIDGDVFVTMGHSFVLPVTRIDNPAARTETVDGHEFNGAFYYTTAAAHKHVWGSLENDASASADCENAATQSKHCTICGAANDDSTVNLPVDSSRHSYTPYKEYQAASRILGDGVERRVCTCCGAHEDRPGAASSTATANSSETFADNQTNQCADRKLLSEIQNGTHFYPTPENPKGKDLLIEYSILWNHTLLNLDPGTDKAPFIETQISSWSNTDKNTLAWWSPTYNIADSWCKYAGGFEAGVATTRSTEGLAYTPEWMVVNPESTDHTFVYSDYPNIGGATSADAGNLTNGHEWGWHHVQIRFHQEVRNATNLAKGTENAKYKFVLTTYIDGVPISMLECNDKPNAKNRLFTAENDGNGGITYSDNAYLDGKDNVKRTVWAYRLNTRKALAGKTVYWEEGDIHYTCGNEFPLKVEKVATPAYKDYVIPDTDVHVNAAVYYQFDND